jgi:hypothetical protein
MLIKQNQLVINGTTLEQSDLQAIANVASDVQAQIDTKLPLGGGTMTGIIAGFESTGIDDNASATAVTITSDGGVGIGTATISGAKLEISGGGIDIQDSGYPRVRFYVGSAFKGGVEAVQNAGSMISTSAVNDLAIRSQSDMLFAAGGNTERMRIDSSGNVGIGTSSIAANTKLIVKAATDQNLEVEYTSGKLRLSALNDARSANVPLQFTSTSFEFLSGNVGIGTDSPGAKLHIRGINEPSHIRLQRHESDEALDNGDEIGGIEFWANDGTYNSNTSTLRAAIRAETQNTSSGTRLEFWTGNSTSAVEERMRIIADGKVGIGTTSPAEKLHIDSNNNTRLRISTTNTGAVPEIQLYNASKEWKIGVETSTDSGGGAYSGAGANYFHIRNATDNNPAQSFFTDGSAYFHRGTILWNNREDIGRVDQGNTGSYYTSYGIQKFQFTIPSDNVWYDVLTNFRESTGYFWATVSDASSRRKQVYCYNMTSPAYGVSTFDLVHDHGGGWNTGNFNFRRVNDGSSSFRLQCQRSSYYSSSNISNGRITFLVF